MPTFSVIIPTYNKANVIERAIRNVLNQSYSDLELIVVNDGSTDNTREVVAPYIALDSRIKTINQANAGVSAARNAGAEHSSGDYIVFLDDDDEVDAEWLSNFHTLLAGNKDLAFCAARFNSIRAETKIKLPKNLGHLYHNLIGIFNAGTYAVRRSLFLQAGKFDPEIRFGENYDLGVRIASLNPKSLHNRKPYLIYNKEMKRDPVNLKNRIQAKSLMLKKYKELNLLSGEHYRQFEISTGMSMAVDLFQLNEPENGRGILFRLLKRSPFSLQVWIRLALSFTTYYERK